MAKNEAIEFLELQDGVWQNTSAKKLKVRLTLQSAKKSQAIVSYFFDNAWVCVGTQMYLVKDPSDMREEVYVYDSRAGDKYPTPKRFEAWLKGNETPMKARRLSYTDITEWERCSRFPDSAFRLSAFGLPEPAGIVWPKPLPWYLWFMGIAAVSLVLGWFLWRNLQKRKLAAAAPTPKLGNAI